MSEASQARDECAETLKRLRIDPALAGGMILTTVTDVVGFAALLGLGTLFLA